MTTILDLPDDILGVIFEKTGNQVMTCTIPKQQIAPKSRQILCYTKDGLSSVCKRFESVVNRNDNLKVTKEEALENAIANSENRRNLRFIMYQIYGYNRSLTVAVEKHKIDSIFNKLLLGFEIKNKHTFVIERSKDQIYVLK